MPEEVTQEGLVKFTVKELLASYQSTLLATLEDLKREVRELGLSKASNADVALLAARQARTEDYLADLRALRLAEQNERERVEVELTEVRRLADAHEIIVQRADAAKASTTALRAFALSVLGVVVALAGAASRFVH